MAVTLVASSSKSLRLVPLKEPNSPKEFLPPKSVLLSGLITLVVFGLSTVFLLDSFGISSAISQSSVGLSQQSWRCLLTNYFPFAAYWSVGNFVSVLTGKRQF